VKRLALLAVLPSLATSGTVAYLAWPSSSPGVCRLGKQYGASYVYDAAAICGHHAKMWRAKAP